MAKPQLDGLRNASFVVICLFVGFVAGKFSPSYRPLVGALSVPLAGFSAGALVHVLLRVDRPFLSPPSGHYEWTMAIVADRLIDDGVLQDPERGRETLRQVLGERIKLKPDESGAFLWAEYSLGIQALLPSAEIMVAGACYLSIYLMSTWYQVEDRHPQATQGLVRLIGRFLGPVPQLAN